MLGAPLHHSLLFAYAQKAAAIDPHNVAAQPGPEGEAAAQVRHEACAGGGCRVRSCAGACT